MKRILKACAFWSIIIIFLLVSINLYNFGGFWGSSILGIELSELDTPYGIFNADLLKITILAYIVPIVFLIIILFILEMPSLMNFSSKGLLNGLKLGWLFILGAIIAFSIGFDFSKASTVPQEKWILLPPLAIFSLLVGVCEEFMCRGVLYNVILRRYGNIRNAALISSAFFGLIHLANIAGTLPLVETLFQVIYAFGFGFLFAAVYARCKNIWAVVILHAIVNFGAFASVTLIQPTGNEYDAWLRSIVIFCFAISIPAIILSLYLLKKSKADMVKQHNHYTARAMRSSMISKSPLVHRLFNAPCPLPAVAVGIAVSLSSSVGAALSLSPLSPKLPLSKWLLSLLGSPPLGGSVAMGVLPVSASKGRPPKSPQPLPVTPLNGSSTAAKADAGKAVKTIIATRNMLHIFTVGLFVDFID